MVKKSGKIVAPSRKVVAPSGPTEHVPARVRKVHFATHKSESRDEAEEIAKLRGIRRKAVELRGIAELDRSKADISLQAVELRDALWSGMECVLSTDFESNNRHSLSNICWIDENPSTLPFRVTRMIPLDFIGIGSWSVDGSRPITMSDTVDLLKFAIQNLPDIIRKYRFTRLASLYIPRSSVGLMTDENEFVNMEIGKWSNLLLITNILFKSCPSISREGLYTWASLMHAIDRSYREALPPDDDTPLKIKEQVNEIVTHEKSDLYPEEVSHLYKMLWNVLDISSVATEMEFSSVTSTNESGKRKEWKSSHIHIVCKNVSFHLSSSLNLSRRDAEIVNVGCDTEKNSDVALLDYIKYAVFHLPDRWWTLYGPTFYHFAMTPSVTTLFLHDGWSIYDYDIGCPYYSHKEYRIGEGAFFVPFVHRFVVAAFSTERRFIEYALLATSEMCSSPTPTDVVLVIPNVEAIELRDDPFFESPMVKARHILNKETYYVQDVITGESVLAKFDTTLMVFSNREEREVSAVRRSSSAFDVGYNERLLSRVEEVARRPK